MALLRHSGCTKDTKNLDFQIDYQPIDNFGEHTKHGTCSWEQSTVYDYMPPDATEDNNKIAIHLNKMCNIWNHNVAGHYILNDHTLFLDTVRLILVGRNKMTKEQIMKIGYSEAEATAKVEEYQNLVKTLTGVEEEIYGTYN
jgi:hypothetical protein